MTSLIKQVLAWGFLIAGMCALFVNIPLGLYLMMLGGFLLAVGRSMNE